MQHHALRNPVRKPLPVVAAGLMLLNCAPSAVLAEGAPFFSAWVPMVAVSDRAVPPSLDTVDLFFWMHRKGADAMRDREKQTLMALAFDPASPVPKQEPPDENAAAALPIIELSSSDLWPSGVAAWLGLPPGVTVEGRGTLDPRAEGNIASLRVLQGERIGLTAQQGGFGNRFGPLRLWGDDHSVSVRQDGTGNLGFIGGLVGFSQSVALRQLGTNIADIMLAGFGEDNEIFIDQVGNGRGSLRVEGLRNSIHLRQDYLSGSGGDNLFHIEVDGSDNVLRVEQDGESEIAVTIIGNNNAFLRSGSALGDLNLLSGQLVQSGQGSRVVIEVEGASNQFGILQQGDRSNIHIRQTGDVNQAGISQASAGSSVAVVQSGSGNSVSVSQ